MDSLILYDVYSNAKTPRIGAFCFSVFANAYSTSGTSGGIGGGTTGSASKSG